MSRIRATFTKAYRDADLHDEMRGHLELLAAEFERQGMRAEDARLAARRAFGGVEQMKEAYRDRRTLRWLEDFVRDVRYALRGLRRNPGFTAVAVLTLALGIGGSTAIFAVVYGYLFQEAPVRDPDSLVAFRWEGDNFVRQMSSEHAYVAGGETRGVGGTFPVGFFEQLQGTRTLSDVVALAPAGSLNIVADGRGDPATGQFVSGRFFGTLGVSAERGRLIVPADDVVSAEPVVVLSHPYWIRRFGMDSNVVGKGIAINGVAFTIAGVAPASFRDLSRRGLPDPPDVAIPLMHELRLRRDNSMLGTPAAWWLTVMGRRAPGVTIPQIEANLAGVLTGVVEAYVPGQTPEDRARLQIPRLRVVAAGRGLADPSPEVMTRFRILAIIALIVLLVVCVNVANLLLSRSVIREREIAVRKAIGASRARIVTQLLTEAFVLAGVAGVVALLIAFASGSLLGAVVGDSAHATAFDAPVLAFAGVLSMVTAMVFGAIPAIRATGALSAPGIRQGAGSFPPRARLGRSLLIAQVALSFPLLVAAGLFLRTLVNLKAVEIGFDPENIVLFTLEPELSGYDRPRGTALYQRIEARLLRVPGVRSVTTSAFGSSLMDGGGVVMSMGGEAQAPTLAVDQNFFATLGIALKRGRMFAPSDTATSTRVAIVNETFAKRFFPDADPIGRSFRAGFQFEVIGVVADARVNSLREPPPPTIYRSVTQLPLPGRRVIVRTAADAEALIPGIRDAMRDVDPNLPLQNVSTQVDNIEARYLVNERMFAATSSAVGGLVLAVTMIGLFGLMSYTVARRTKELGIRMALGAQRAQVLRSVLGDALIVVGAGLLVGFATALAMGRLLETLIFGLSRHDPLSLSFAALLMFIAAAVAGYLPARRATKVDPVIALRVE